MLSPGDYAEDTRAVCGRLLPHNDSITSEETGEGFEATKRLWASKYKTSYVASPATQSPGSCTTYSSCGPKLRNPRCSHIFEGELEGGGVCKTGWMPKSCLLGSCNGTTTFFDMFWRPGDA